MSGKERITRMDSLDDVDRRAIRKADGAKLLMFELAAPDLSAHLWGRPGLLRCKTSLLAIAISMDRAA
jgi:hypothetical protein